MVSIYITTDEKAQAVAHVRCLSTDDKPTANIPNGSDLIEINTGKVYLFDIDGNSWDEV